jgi:SagB-type dehydrogenase family enzyme
MSVEQALHQRRSIREYKQDEPLTLEEVSQLLWAAQGVTSADGLRTAPSAGALFPLEVYVVAGNVRTLQPGFYHYQSREHAIVRLTEGDKRRELCGAALDQDQLRDAPAIIVFSAVYERTMKKYLDRGKQYVHFEIGHAAQNVFLQAEALGLGTVPVGAFNDEEVKRVLGLSEVPLYLMPVGRK